MFMTRTIMTAALGAFLLLDVGVGTALASTDDSSLSITTSRVNNKAYGSIDEFGRNQAQKSQDSELLKRSELPGSCTLKSYLQNGTMSHFVCNGKDLFTGIVIPKEGIDEKAILEYTTAISGCNKEQQESEIGFYVLCQTPEHMLMKNYVRTNNSGLILTAVTPEDVHVSDVAALQNLGLEIYFVIRKIASSDERVDYLLEKMKSSKECISSECLWE